MTFILFPGVTFPESPIGKQVIDINQRIANLPSLHSHMNVAEGNYYTGLSGEVVVRDLANSAAEFVTATGRNTGPEVHSNVLNGHNVLRFNGDKSLVGGLERTIADMPTGDNSISFACVAKVTAPDISQAQHIVSTGTVTDYGFNLATASGNIRAQLNPGAVTMGVQGEWIIMICSAKGTKVKGLDINDLETVYENDAAHANGLASLFIGQHSLQGSQLIADVAENLVLATDIFDPSEAETLDTIKTYYQTKFNL